MTAPLCAACEGVGRLRDAPDDPCWWCNGTGRASPHLIRARRLANLDERITRLTARREALRAEAEHIDRMILAIEAQRASTLAEGDT